MRHYRHNARWLLWYAPFRGLSFSAAYVTPFFIEHGLDTSQIFLLQSIFSIAYLLWEIPSGIIADRIGRARSIQLSAPIAAIGMVAYGLSGEFWQFVVCELIIALANGLISGADTALLIDSLKADDREHEFTKISQRMNAIGFASTAAAVPIAIALVHLWGVSSTLLADGLSVLPGLFFVGRLSEAPRFNGNQNKQRQTAWKALGELWQNAHVRWLIGLRTTLNTATYIGFWLAAFYYAELGISVTLFGAILAARSLLKAWLSHRFHHQTHLLRTMFAYATLVGGVCLAMASGLPWLAWMIIGHDIVQALASAPIIERLNGHMDQDHRATLNSVANLTQRLAYTIAGPLVGLAVDRLGLSAGLVLLGITSSTAGYISIWRLHKLKALA